MEVSNEIPIQNFFCHPKRQMALERAISQTQPESSVHKLKDLCRTRWVQRIDDFEVFCSYYQSTVTCLESSDFQAPAACTLADLDDRLVQAVSSTWDKDKRSPPYLSTTLTIPSSICRKFCVTILMRFICKQTKKWLRVLVCPSWVHNLYSKVICNATIKQHMGRRNTF